MQHDVMQNAFYNQVTTDLEGIFMSIGEHLKKLRQESGLTQRDLAEALKMPHRQISRYELNVDKPSVKNLIKLAEYFEVSIDQLIYGFSKEAAKRSQLNDMELLDVFRQVDCMKRPKREKIKWAFKAILDGETHQKSA